jgi:hypothetical protein
MSRAEIKRTKVFDSVSGFTQWARDTARMTGSRCSSTDGSDQWCGGSEAMAYELGLSGGYWAEGAAKMAKQMTITRDMQALAPMPTRERAVQGHMPCVPAHIMGHPLSMFKQGEDLSSGKPVISIGLSMIQSADNSGDDRI